MPPESKPPTGTPEVPEASSQEKVSFGAYLRRERELRLIKLDEIAESTKVKRDFLEALEREEFELLPGEVFVRGFIQSYAKYIGLDPQEALTEYDHYLQVTKEPEAASDKKKAPTSNKTGLLIGGVILFFIVGGLLIYSQEGVKVATESQITAPETDTEPQKSDPLDLIAPKDKIAVIPPQKPLPGASPLAPPEEHLQATAPSALPREREAVASTATTESSREPDTFIPPRKSESEVSGVALPEEFSPEAAVEEQKLTLTIKARERTWLLIQVDGAEVLDFVLKPDESKG